MRLQLQLHLHTPRLPGYKLQLLQTQLAPLNHALTTPNLTSERISAEGQVVTWPKHLAFQLTSAGLFMRGNFVHSVIKKRISMHSKIILIYCICDDFLSAFGLKDDKQCRMTSAEILNVAIVSALFFHGNFSRTRLILKCDGYIPNMLSEGRLNRRLHEIDISVWESIFMAITQVLDKEK